MKKLLALLLVLSLVFSCAVMSVSAADGDVVFDIGPDDVTLAGDTWPDHPEQYGDAPYTFAGILSKDYGKSTENTKREIVETTLSDGSAGKAIRFAHDGPDDTGSVYSGAGNYLCNVPCLKSGTTYTLRAVMKIKDGAPVRAGNANPIRDYYLFANIITEDAAMKLSTDETWHTYDYTFTTKDGIDSQVFWFTMGSDPSSAFLFDGFEVLIESVKLVEGNHIPETGDASLIAAAVISVALAAAVVFTKKRSTAK